MHSTSLSHMLQHHSWVQAFCIASAAATFVCEIIHIHRFLDLCELSHRGQINCGLRPLRLLSAVFCAAFATACVIVESRLQFCCHLQLWFIRWQKMLTRLWGRSCFYLALALLVFSQGTVYGIVCAGLLTTSSLLCFVTACTASAKLRQLRTGLLGGAPSDEAEADVRRIRMAFDKVDVDHSGFLDKSELMQVAAELGAAPNATELSAMFSLLDSDVQGKVSFEAFRCMWLGEAEYRWV